MMCRINEHQGLFCALDSGANSTVNQLGYVTAMSSAPQDDDKTDKPTFEYQVAAHPDTLTGIAFLWEIVYKNPRDAVIERAAQLLTKLYINPTRQLMHQRNEIQGQFIKIVLDNIKTVYDTKSEVLGIGI